VASYRRGSKRKSPGRLSATAAAPLRLWQQAEEDAGTGRRRHSRAVRQVQICPGRGHQIFPAAAQNRRHHDPVGWGLRHVLGVLVGCRICFSVDDPRMRALAGSQTLRFESGRARVHSFSGRDHRLEGGAAERLDRIGGGHWRADSGIGRGAVVPGPLSGHRQPDVPKPGLHRLFPQPVQPHAHRVFGWRPHCHRALAVAVAGGIGRAPFPDRDPVQFHPASDFDLLGAPSVFALPAQNRRGTPVFRGDAGAAPADGRALLRPHRRAGAGHAHDAHPAPVTSRARRSSRNPCAR